jgi:hypothetical protein
MISLPQGLKRPSPPSLDKNAKVINSTKATAEKEPLARL